MTPAELRRWVATAPAGTLVPAAALTELLDDAGEPPAEATAPETPLEASWRERLWTAPCETRLGVAEVAEALGRPRSYVYARTGPKAEDPLPHRKLDGAVTITAGELRTWIRTHELEVVGAPMTPAAR